MKNPLSTPKTYRLITKARLIKELKANDNFNLSFVENLSYMSNELYSLGNHEEMQMNTTERQYNSFYEKAYALVDSVSDLFEEKIQRKLKAQNIKDELARIERANYGRETEAVQILFSELAKNMTAEEVLQVPTEEIKFALDGEEYISVGGRTSTWSYYISGSVTTQGKTFRVENVSCGSDTNRL